MITYPRYSRYPRRDCLHVMPRQILMVYKPEETENVITLQADWSVLEFVAAYVNPVTRQPTRVVPIRLQGPTTVYLVRSHKYVGWFYIVQFSKRAQKHVCTCAESYSNSYCQHVDDLPATANTGIA